MSTNYILSIIDSLGNYIIHSTHNTQDIYCILLALYSNTNSKHYYHLINLYSKRVRNYRRFQLFIENNGLCDDIFDDNGNQIIVVNNCYLFNINVVYYYEHYSDNGLFTSCMNLDNGNLWYYNDIDGPTEIWLSSQKEVFDTDEHSTESKCNGTPKDTQLCRQLMLYTDSVTNITGANIFDEWIKNIKIDIDFTKDSWSSAYVYHDTMRIHCLGPEVIGDE